MNRPEAYNALSMRLVSTLMLQEATILRLPRPDKSGSTTARYGKALLHIKAGKVRITLADNHALRCFLIKRPIRFRASSISGIEAA